MLIHVVGEDEESARAHLDQHGGYVGAREVSLVNETPISAKDENLSQLMGKPAPTKLTVVD